MYIRFLRPLLAILLTSFICLPLTGCQQFPPRIYRMDVRQGNHLEPELVHQLKKGMSKEQVINLLGTPALSHSLHSNRWDYYYYLKPGNGGEIIEKHVIVYFKNGKLIEVRR